VFYRFEDLYTSVGIHGGNGWATGAPSEATVLAELTCAAQIRCQPSNGRRFVSLLVSGAATNEARDHILPPILDAWSHLRDSGIPLIGYLSASRSGEALNFCACKLVYKVPDCMTFCPNQLENTLSGVRSTAGYSPLDSRQLQPGQRSAVASSALLDLYGDHAIYFCYVHVGTEIARIDHQLG